jgi:hypothetical protein
VDYDILIKKTLLSHSPYGREKRIGNWFETVVVGASISTRIEKEKGL